MLASCVAIENLPQAHQISKNDWRWSQGTFKRFYHAASVASVAGSRTTGTQHFLITSSERRSLCVHRCWFDRFSVCLTAILLWNGRTILHTISIRVRHDSWYDCTGVDGGGGGGVVEGWWWLYRNGRTGFNEIFRKRWDMRQGAVWTIFVMLRFTPWIQDSFLFVQESNNGWMDIPKIMWISTQETIG